MVDVNNKDRGEGIHSAADPPTTRIASVTTKALFQAVDRPLLDKSVSSAFPVELRRAYTSLTLHRAAQSREPT